MLPTVSDLFKRALTPYRKYPKLMVSFMSLMFLPVFFLGTAKFSIDLMRLVYGPFALHAIFWLIGSITVSLLSLWLNLACMLSIADIDQGRLPERVHSYLKKTKKMVLPVFGLTFIVGLIVASGFLILLTFIFISSTIKSGPFVYNTILSLGGLLFLIGSILVGLLFSIWFIFFVQARVLDEKKGLDSLRYSKQLSRKNWWGIFFKISITFLVIWIVGGVISGLLNAIFRIDISVLTLQKLTIVSFAVTVFTALIQAVLMPFAAAIPTILYLDLKKTQSAPREEPKSTQE